MPNAYVGTAGNDSWTVISPGTFSLDGLGGVDTLNLGTSLRSNYTITQASDGSVHVDSLSSASGGALLHATLYNMEILTFNSGQDVLDLRTYFGPPPPTYALTAATASVNEGAHDQITLTTTNVAAGTIENYAISGIAANRLASGTLTGHVAVDSSGKAVIDLGVVANNHTDGSTTATVTIGSNLASVSVTVNDTSLTPATTNTFTGTTGNDIFKESAGNNSIDGVAGLDTVIYTGNQSAYKITVSANNTELVQKPSGGTDTLTNIERVQFADTKIAFDLDGNAGTVAKILGAVFGEGYLSNPMNPTYVGIGLSYLDGAAPMSYANLMQLALNAAGATTSNAVVTLLWKNLFGAAPTAAQAAPYVTMLDNGSYTAGTLGVLAADTSFNTTNINLVGLHQTGIHYA